MKYLSVFLLLNVLPTTLFAIDVSSFFYQEVETGGEAVDVRYTVSDDFLRIDEGSLNDDFILFDRQKKTIYSVNQSDKTILYIESHDWQLESFSFSVNVKKTILKDAPKVSGQLVVDFKKMADLKTCQHVQLLSGVYKKEMQVFSEYLKVLSGQQVKNIMATPVEMRSPCFMLDQVYNTGEYYQLGLPIMEWHSRGYSKFLTNYKNHSLGEQWFVLPADFKRYTL